MNKNTRIYQYKSTDDDQFFKIVSYSLFLVLINDSNEEADGQTFRSNHFEMDEPEEVNKTQKLLVEIASFRLLNLNQMWKKRRKLCLFYFH
jgi:hypothetical protein